MPITEEQRIARRAHIGSSDMPVIAGVSYAKPGASESEKNLADLWLEKTGRLAPEKSKRAADLGTDLEGAIISAFARRMGRKPAAGRLFVREGIFSANVDALYWAPSVYNIWGDAGPPDLALGAGIQDLESGVVDSVVEAKSTGYQEFWGEQVDQVPWSVLVQVQHQMWVTACDVAWVPVLFPGHKRFDLQVYQVPRSDVLIDELLQLGHKFWRCVETDTPPEAVTPHLEALRRRQREPKSVISLTDRAAELWAQKEKFAETRALAQADEERIKAEIIALLGDAEAGSLPDGSSITYLEQNGARHCDFEALELELRAIGRADLYDRLVRLPRFRVLRHKKAQVIGKRRHSWNATHLQQ